MGGSNIKEETEVSMEGPGAKLTKKMEGFAAWDVLGHLDVYLEHTTLSVPMFCVNGQESRRGQSIPRSCPLWLGKQDML